jgi:23S rRNA pseudouridine1911/1915/1917 synthase
MTAPELPAVEALWAEDDESRREALVVEPPEEGQRLDRLVAERLPELSRSYAQSLIDDGYVAVDGRTRKASYRVRAGETVAVLVPPPAPIDPEPEAIPLAIIYEDADVLVIDKPAGMVTHPAPGHEHGTVVNAVLAHAPEVHINGSVRPGIVHRLDKDTSGLLIVAKHERAFALLAAQFQERRTVKRYIALVDGQIDPDEGTIDVPIGRDPRARQRMAAIREGRAAISHFQVRERFVGYTLADVRIETGRTHQIRVHMAFIGHPVTGDVVYGEPRVVARLPLKRQFLHAAGLGITLPNGEWHDFVAPLPPDLEETLTILRAEVEADRPLA